jgi:integrase/recombinase XerD
MEEKTFTDKINLSNIPAALALLWNIDVRPHEVSLLKIKHIRLRERYGEGEIPHEAKTGTGSILLTYSFPYVRE